MTFEHFALNVPDARAHALWFVECLGFSIVRQKVDAPFTHFVADSSGRPIVELYSNPSVPVFDFRQTVPLTFHIALIASDARAESARLTAGGATFLTEENLPDGGRLIMLRDPWGVPLQLCQRIQPLAPTA